MTSRLQGHDEFRPDRYTANLTTFLTVTAIHNSPIERIASFSELGLAPCYYGGSTKWFLEHEHPTIRGVDLKTLKNYDPDRERYSQLFQALRDGECSGIVSAGVFFSASVFFFPGSRGARQVTWTHYARNVIIHDELRGGGPTGCDIEPVGPEEGVVCVSGVFSFFGR